MTTLSHNDKVDFNSIIDDVDVAAVPKEDFDNSKNHSQNIDDLEPNPVYEEPKDEEEDSEDTEDADEADDSDDSEEGDEEEVDFEDYNITLPNGEEVTLAELTRDYKDSQQIKAAWQEIEEARERFVEESKNVVNYMELSKLEADAIVEDYEDYDWNRAKKEDPEDYILNKDYYDKAVQRKKDLQKALKRIREEEEDKEARQRQLDVANANATLARNLPEWGQKLWDEIYDYGLSVNIPQQALDTCTDAATIETLYKAMLFDKGQRVAKAKIKKLGAPTKVAKSEGSNKQVKNPGKAFDQLMRGDRSAATKRAAFDALVD